MLLRRVAEHVKDQNWFAVILDFIIVVVGILIAFQVANWNEARATSEIDDRLLGRLINDLQIMQQQYVQNESIVRRMHAGWVSVFRSLENCTEAPKERDEFNFALSQYQRTITVGVQRSAYDEMKSIGAFSRLNSVDLQNQISIFYSNMDGQADAVNIGRANQLAAGRIMWKSIAFSFSSDDADVGEPDAWATVAFDPLEHCHNLEFRGAVWELVDVNRDWLNVKDNNTVMIEQILTQLRDARL